MTDRLMSIFAFAILTAFLGILVWKVPRLDLGAVIAVTVALVAWDFFGPKRK
ncbi:hypothetical protein [Ostreiculturibacter nitratireducens]|uniref:hypothetical protein n=1 Tax=Ostreiculturibacter nitratireducens TaxID=3075226 RepID=UPI0031B572FC